MTNFFCRTVGLALILLPVGLLSANAAPAGQESIPQFGFAYYGWSKTENALQRIPGDGPGLRSAAAAGGRRRCRAEIAGRDRCPRPDRRRAVDRPELIGEFGCPLN